MSEVESVNGVDHAVGQGVVLPNPIGIGCSEQSGGVDTTTVTTGASRLSDGVADICLNGDESHCQQGSQLNSQVSKMVAPTLRVEELKEDSHSIGSGLSEDDSGHSQGEASDLDPGGRSGSELAGDDEGKFEPPDDELKTKIIQQVEFYFSDTNIVKDAFLLKHIRRNKQGFVSVKLISSFRKVKKLSKDYRVVAYCLKDSEGLEVNIEGTKVKRIAPLPEYDETTPSRTIVAVNMPMETPTVESVAELFSKCGDIALIRILRPGKMIPPDVKRHVNKHPEIGSTTCAVVEFEQHACAKKACELMTNTEDWRKGMRVVLLAPTKKNREKHDGKHSDNKKLKKNGKSEQTKEQSDFRVGSPSSEPPPMSDKIPTPSSNKKSRKQKNPRLDDVEHRAYSSSPEMDDGEGGVGQVRRNSGGYALVRNSLSPVQDTNRLSPTNTPRNTPKSSPRSSPRGSPNTRRRVGHGKSPLAAESMSPGTNAKLSPSVSPEMRRRTNSGGSLGGSSPSSPWVQRRLKAQQETSPLAGNSPSASPRFGRRLADGSLPQGAPPPKMAGMEGIIRQPIGPDGTKGFQDGKGRGKPLQPSS